MLTTSLTSLRLLSGVEILSEDDALKVRVTFFQVFWQFALWHCFMLQQLTESSLDCTLHTAVNHLSTVLNSGASHYSIYVLCNQKSFEAQHSNTVIVSDLSCVCMCGSVCECVCERTPLFVSIHRSSSVVSYN